jgi:hypothetical protein
MEPVLLDAAGRRRSPATLPGYDRGRPPRNKGLRYPADPPTIEEIVAVMRYAGDRPDGLRAPDDAVATSVVARQPNGPLAAWPQARENRSDRGCSAPWVLDRRTLRGLEHMHARGRSG